MILRALVRKEFIELGRDPVTLAVAVLLLATGASLIFRAI